MHAPSAIENMERIRSARVDLDNMRFIAKQDSDPLEQDLREAVEALDEAYGKLWWAVERQAIERGH